MSQVSLRRLSDEEVDNGFGRKSTVDLSEFMDALSELTIGDGAEVQLDGMTLRTVRRRMNTSAKKMGLSLKWGKRGTDFDTHFVVRQANAKNGEDGELKRRGRPPKVILNGGIPVPKPVRKARRAKEVKELVAV